MIREIEKEILKVLHNNIGNRALTSKQIYRELIVSDDIGDRDIEFYLENLKEKSFVRSKRTKMQKFARTTFPDVVTFELSDKGVSLVESDFILSENLTKGRPNTIIYGNNVNFGQINYVNMNINVYEAINQIEATDIVKEEIKKILEEINSEIEKDTVSKNILKTLFNKVAEKGFDKLTDVIFAYVGSKILS